VTAEPAHGGKPKPSPERVARTNRLVLGICTVFFAVAALCFGAYALHSHQDYAVRTAPPDGETTAVVVDQVTEGRHCASTGRSTNCSPEYTLEYVVDGERHETAIRERMEPGDRVHAFKGSDGRWYVTEDPGFGNSRWAWTFYAGAGVAFLLLAAVCVRARLRIPKPT
jgi:hypothetical protein